MIKIKIIYSLFLLLLTLVACDSSSSEQPKILEKSLEDTIASQENPVTEKLESLEFEGKVTTNETKESIVKIDIYKKGETTIFQTLDGVDLPYQVDNPFFDTPTFEDLNFDGTPDLRMPESLGNANVYYAYWIYNPITKSFESNTEMTLSLPKVDATKKEIMSFERNSAASYIETTYSYQNGKFIKIRIENKEYQDEKTYQSIVEERQEDGTMKEVRNELVKE